MNGSSHYGSHQPQSPYATGSMNGGFNGGGPYAGSGGGGGGGGAGQYMHRGQIYGGNISRALRHKHKQTFEHSRD